MARAARAPPEAGDGYIVTHILLCRCWPHVFALLFLKYRIALHIGKETGLHRAAAGFSEINSLPNPVV